MSQSKSLVLSPEQKLQQRVEVVRIARQQGTQAAALRAGVPERTVRDWKRKFLEHGVEGLKEKSRVPKVVANRKDEKGVWAFALIALDRDEPGLTQLQILAKLHGEKSDETPTLAWMARARKRLGLSRKRRKKRDNPHRLRYERPIPGFLQIDTKMVEEVGGHPDEKIYQFTAIDECSRVRFLASHKHKSALAATDFLMQAVAFYRRIGVEVLQAQTDNGTEFTLPHNEITIASYARGETDEAMFTLKCRGLGIRHRLIKPRTPELNGKVERSHRIDEDRFYSRFEFGSTAAHDHALKQLWTPEYNEQRPHGALGGLTPMEFLKAKLEQMRNDPELARLAEQLKAQIQEILRADDDKAAA